MPLRLSAQLFGASLCFRPSSSCTTSINLSRITLASASTQATKKRREHDPYKVAQTLARKEANLSRQRELTAERKASLGDPVRGVTTPFVQSFDNPQGLNHFLRKEELETSIRNSYLLTQPVASMSSRDPEKENQLNSNHAAAHERASEALSRIVALSNGNSKDKTRANVINCIETFGRHNTDRYLQRKAPSSTYQDMGMIPTGQTVRAGPDTGSSEVQIAILTAKIRVLADSQEVVGHKDKVNKRNLRLLVHRRQKLLKYLRKKERGSERWTNVVNKLGLTNGTWKEEISL